MQLKIESPTVYRALDFVNTKFSSGGQRFILGVTALASQPFIDLHNRHVDEETRWTSAMRTIAKIVVGTAAGVLVRHYSIKMVKHCPCFWRSVNSPGLPVMPSKELWKTPEKCMKELRYANTMGTLIGTAVGLVTNFAIDAPLTKILTNYLNENAKPKLMEKFAKKEPANEKEAKYDKIV